MTKEAFKRAIELNEKMEVLQRERDALERVHRKCWGIDSGVVEKKFRVEVSVPGGKIGAFISDDSAKAALEADIEMISIQLRELREEFRELK